MGINVQVNRITSCFTGKPAYLGEVNVKNGFFNGSSSIVQISVVKLSMIEGHPPIVEFDSDSEPPKSPDTGDLSSSAIEVSSRVSVRESPDNTSPSLPGHSLNPSVLDVPVKSRSMEQMWMAQESSSLKLTVWVKCLIMYFSETDCLFSTQIKSTPVTWWLLMQQMCCL